MGPVQTRTLDCGFFVLQEENLENVGCCKAGKLHLKLIAHIKIKLIGSLVNLCSLLNQIEVMFHKLCSNAELT